MSNRNAEDLVAAVLFLAIVLALHALFTHAARGETAQEFLINQARAGHAARAIYYVKRKTVRRTHVHPARQAKALVATAADGGARAVIPPGRERRASLPIQPTLVRTISFAKDGRERPVAPPPFNGAFAMALPVDPDDAAPAPPRPGPDLPPLPDRASFKAFVLALFAAWCGASIYYWRGIRFFSERREAWSNLCVNCYGVPTTQ